MEMVWLLEFSFFFKHINIFKGKTFVFEFEYQVEVDPKKVALGMYCKFISLALKDALFRFFGYMKHFSIRSRGHH